MARIQVLSGLCALVFSAFAASATEHEVASYGGILDACFIAAGNGEALEACRGKMSDACMEHEDGGYSTLGMSSCISAETLVWDRYLNAEYGKTMRWAKAADADDAVHFPEFARRTDTLRAAQRAWIAYRDAECGLAYALWGAGSMRTIVASGCMLDMTARRTIDLHDMREPFE